MDVPLILDVENGIATITLNRPEVGNALNTPLLLLLKDNLQRLAADDSVAVLILTGAGRMFCSGEDLRGMAQPDTAEPQIAATMAAFALLHDLPQPTIAAVNGFALTGGLELLLACDLRIASEQAQFGDTHARVGMLPGAGDTQRLPRLVGLARAKEMLFTSRFITAEEAAQIGLVNRVVPAERLLDEARLLAEQIKANGPIIRRFKKMVNDGWQRTLEEGMLLEQVELQRAMLELRVKGVGPQRQDVIDRNRASR